MTAKDHFESFQCLSLEAFLQFLIANSRVFVMKFGDSRSEIKPRMRGYRALLCIPCALAASRFNLALKAMETARKQCKGTCPPCLL